MFISMATPEYLQQRIEALLKKHESMIPTSSQQHKRRNDNEGEIENDVGDGDAGESTTRRSWDTLLECVMLGEGLTLRSRSQSDGQNSSTNTTSHHHHHHYRQQQQQYHSLPAVRALSPLVKSIFSARHVLSLPQMPPTLNRQPRPARVGKSNGSSSTLSMTLSSSSSPSSPPSNSTSSSPPSSPSNDSPLFHTERRDSVIFLDQFSVVGHIRPGRSQRMSIVFLSSTPLPISLSTLFFIDHNSGQVFSTPSSMTL